MSISKLPISGHVTKCDAGCVTWVSPQHPAVLYLTWGPRTDAKPTNLAGIVDANLSRCGALRFRCLRPRLSEHLRRGDPGAGGSGRGRRMIISRKSSAAASTAKKAGLAGGQVTELAKAAGETQCRVFSGLPCSFGSLFVSDQQWAAGTVVVVLALVDTTGGLSSIGRLRPGSREPPTSNGRFGRQCKLLSSTRNSFATIASSLSGTHRAWMVTVDGALAQVPRFARVRWQVSRSNLETNVRGRRIPRFCGRWMRSAMPSSVRGMPVATRRSTTTLPNVPGLDARRSVARVESPPTATAPTRGDTTEAGFRRKPHARDGRSAHSATRQQRLDVRRRGQGLP